MNEENQPSESSNFQEMMSSLGLKPPTVKTTQEMGLSEKELEQKQKEFVNKSFDNSPSGVLLNELNVVNTETADDLEKDIIHKYSELKVDDRKKLLISIINRYNNNRKEIYTTLNYFSKDNEIPLEKIKEYTKKIVLLTQQNIAFRKIFIVIGVEIANITETNKFNKYSVDKDLYNLAAIAYSRNVLLPCPKCGNLVPVKAVNLQNLYHENANDFVLALNGKLLQDCEQCDWYFYYDIDALTIEKKNTYKVISEEPTLKIRSGETEKMFKGLLTKNVKQFFISIDHNSTRKDLFNEWSSLIGGKDYPGPGQLSKKNYFSNKNYSFITGEQTVVGIEFGPIINNYLLTMIYFD